MFASLDLFLIFPYYYLSILRSRSFEAGLSIFQGRQIYRVCKSPLPSFAPWLPFGSHFCQPHFVGYRKILIDFANSNLINKIRRQPEKVQQVLDKARTDGPFSAFDAVQSKLDQPLPLGYCNVGTVVAVGAGVTGFQVGDRVASNGPHAELVSVPQNLCALIPPGVTDESASFTVLASIGLQGIRLAQLFWRFFCGKRSGLNRPAYCSTVDCAWLSCSWS